MHFAKGKTRYVLAFPRLGFVIKFPIINLKVFWWTLITFLTARNEITGRAIGHLNIKVLWGTSVKDGFGYKTQLFGGIRANYLERKFWDETRGILLYPTRFSFFGLMNIQKYGEVLSHKEMWIGSHVEKLTDGDSVRYGHGFETPFNYCNHNGYVRMIDYGNDRLWPVIRKWGDDISELTVKECRVKPN